MASELTRDEKMRAIMDRLEAGVQGVLTSDSYAEYLTLMSRFHSYSFGNTILIAIARPDATQVAGFQTWKKLGRNVRKGEKGIAILVPLTYKREEDDGTTTVGVRGFGTGHVFDVAQTEGAPLPEHPANAALLTEDGAAIDRIEDALTAFATQNGVMISEGELSARGTWNPTGREITLRSDLAGLSRVKTLTHEIAHMLAGDRASTADSESVAESAAYVTLAHFGLDTSGYTFGYVAGWGKDMDVVRKNLGAIQKVAHQMIEAIEGNAAKA